MFLSIMNFYNMVIQTTSMQWVCMLKFPLCSVNNHIVKVFFLNKKGCKSLVQNVAKILIWISDMNLKKNLVEWEMDEKWKHKTVGKEPPEKKDV